MIEHWTKNPGKRGKSHHQISNNLSGTTPGRTSWVWAHPHFREGAHGRNNRSVKRDLRAVRRGCVVTHTAREETLRAVHSGCGATHIFLRSRIAPTPTPTLHAVRRWCAHTHAVLKLPWSRYGFEHSHDVRAGVCTIRKAWTPTHKVLRVGFKLTNGEGSSSSFFFPHGISRLSGGGGEDGRGSKWSVELTERSEVRIQRGQKERGCFV